jgi:hypothetical protein
LREGAEGAFGAAEVEGRGEEADGDGAERGGYDLMPEMGYAPTNKYLPPRPRRAAAGCTGAAAELTAPDHAPAKGLLGWIDRFLSG